MADVDGNLDVLTGQPPKLRLERLRNRAGHAVDDAPALLAVKHPVERLVALGHDRSVEQFRVSLRLLHRQAVEVMEYVEWYAVGDGPGHVSGVVRIGAIGVIPAGLDDNEIQLRRELVPVDALLMLGNITDHRRSLPFA